jgi:Raf kinase inhibitor-like YbhB/YbcL family protein
MTTLSPIRLRTRETRLASCSRFASARVALVAGLLAAACSSGGADPKPDDGDGAGGSGGASAMGGKAGGQGGHGGNTTGRDAAAGGTPGGGGGAGGGGAGGAALPDAAPDADQPAPDAAPAGMDMAPVTPGPFVLASTVIKEGDTIATMYRCKFANVSPPLSWGAGPAGTQSYAVTLAHTTSLHWMLWDIPVTTTSLPMGVERKPMPVVPAGAQQDEPGLDGSTWFGYTGPCPSGARTMYLFAVYALDVPSLPGLTPASATKDVNAAIQKHMLARSTITVNGAATDK